MNAKNRMRATLAGTIMVLSVLGLPAAYATHENTSSGWLSFLGLDGSVPSLAGASGHGGSDGPDEPNFGSSHPGGDAEHYPADGMSGAVGAPGGNGAGWGNRTFTSMCTTSGANATVADVTDYGFGSGGAEIFREKVAGNGLVASDSPTSAWASYTGMDDARAGTATDMFDLVWFYGVGVGINYNGALNHEDDTTGTTASPPGDGYSDYAQQHPDNDLVLPKARAPRVWPSTDATAAFGGIYAGSWADLNGDSFIDDTDDPLTDEWTPVAEGSEVNMHGFFDPYSFIGTQNDPDGGLGDAQDAVFTWLDTIPLPDDLPALPACIDGLFPPAIPLPPTNPTDPNFIPDMVTYLTVTLPAFEADLVTWATGLSSTAPACAIAISTWISTDLAGYLDYLQNVYAPALATWLTDTGARITDASDMVFGVQDGATKFASNPQGVDIDASVLCELEIEAIFVGPPPAEFQTSAIFLIDDVPGRAVTTVMFYDADGDMNINEASDLVDIDQYCTDGAKSGSDPDSDSANDPDDISCY